MPTIPKSDILGKILAAAKSSLFNLAKQYRGEPEEGPVLGGNTHIPAFDGSDKQAELRALYNMQYPEQDDYLNKQPLLDGKTINQLYAENGITQEIVYVWQEDLRAQAEFQKLLAIQNAEMRRLEQEIKAIPTANQSAQTVGILGATNLITIGLLGLFALGRCRKTRKHTHHDEENPMLDQSHEKTLSI